MTGGESHPDRQRLLLHTLELAHSLLAVRAEKSRFCWDEAKRSRPAAEEDPVQMKEAMLMERDTRSHSPQALALPWCREIGMGIKVMDSKDKVNLKVSEVTYQEYKGTEKEKEGKDPVAPVRGHSESHCCISGQGRELCGHLGYPKSHADRLVFHTQTLPPALS